MKKLFVTVFIIACLTATITAQTSSNQPDSKFTLGVFGGLNVPKLTDNSNNEISSGYSSRLGPAFGFTSSYSLCSNFALRVDALYSSEGGKRNGMQAVDATNFNPSVPAGTYFYANFDNESILNYIEIPVMAKYHVSICKSSKFYIDFGPYYGYLLNAKQKTSGSSAIYEDGAGTVSVVPVAQSFDAKTNVTSSIKRNNFGITGGVGFTHGFGVGELFLDVRGAYGLTNVQKYSEDGNSHNGYVLIALGYSINL
jgi:hypothetical protein